jgi:uncharacterized Zn finger protein
VSWYDWPESRPIRVEGGLVARSERGAIGTTWWSQRFLSVLESFGLGTRLTRGKAYARQGQVLALTVSPGVVAATVQGSRAKPYMVSIGFPALDDHSWAQIESSLAAQAVHRAQLLAGEMPETLEEVVESAGAALFPRRFNDLTMRCSCPDIAVPCKHIAAAFYLLAERFDDDPFAILLWRGRSREQVLSGLDEASEAAGTRVGSGGLGRALEDLPALDVATALDRFWLSPVPLPSRPPTLDAAADLVLRALPDPPQALGGKALVEELRALYVALPDLVDPAADDPLPSQQRDVP